MLTKSLYILITVAFIVFSIALILHTIVCKSVSTELLNVHIDTSSTERLRQIANRAISDDNYDKEKRLFFANDHERFDTLAFDELVDSPIKFTFLEARITINNLSFFTIRDLHLETADSRLLWTGKGFVTDDQTVSIAPRQKLEMRVRIVFKGNESEIPSLINDLPNLVWLEGGIFSGLVRFRTAPHSASSK